MNYMDNCIKYSGMAQKCLNLAGQLAASLGHATVTTGHVLIAMLIERTSKAYIVLESVGVSEYDAKSELLALRPKVGREVTATAFDPELETALEKTKDFCKNEQGSEIETQHILLGMLSFEGSIAKKILQRLGYDPDIVIEETKVNGSFFSQM